MISTNPTGAPAQVGLEIREGRPWWKFCCVGCLVLVCGILIFIGIAFRGLGGGGPAALSDVPPNFPPSVSLYRVEDAKSIVYLAGKDKDRLIAAVLAPFRWFGRVMVSDRPSDGRGEPASGVSQLQDVDTVTVRWERLDIDREKLLTWYLDMLERNGFRIEAYRDDATAMDALVASREDVRMQVQIQDIADIPGIDSVVAVIDYLNQ